jgi:hypothetical protein
VAATKVPVKKSATTMGYVDISHCGNLSSTMRNFAALQHEIISHREIGVF